MPPVMITSFNQLPLGAELKQVIRELGFQQPTPIQSLAIPPLLKGLDVIGQSKTGSGKTAAFAIPLLEKIQAADRQTQVLVLSPTRELCLQVAREIRKLGRYKKDLHVLTLSGGHPVYLDLRSLQQGAQIIVGTPGRIMDHLDRKTIDFSAIQILVVDEADRMLDMGFRENIEFILEKTPTNRQTVLFSATFPSTIENLSKRFQNNAQRLTIETEKEEIHAIEQKFYHVEADEKTLAILTLLRSHHLESTLVFCNQKYQVDELFQSLRRTGHSADKLHGGLEQLERERVMAKFRNGSTRILIATDVAARGIDIAGLDAVINYDMQSDPEQYIHRIGRTGRAGAKGLAVSFVTKIESAKIDRLQQFTGTEISLKPLGALTGNLPKGNSIKTKDAIPNAPMVTVSISGGRKDKLRPGDILGALTGDAGVLGDHVGKIEIFDHISYVAIRRSSSNMALTRLSQGKIKGRRFVVQAVH